MKKVVLILLALVCFVGISNAQKKDMNLSVGAEVSLPQGSGIMDNFNTGFGGTVNFEYGFSKQLYGVATAGYVMWSADDYTYLGYNVETSMTAIPVMGGVKYYFDKKGGIYAIAQAGLYMFTVTAEVAGTSTDASDEEFTIRAGAGYEFELSKKMMLDISAMYVIISDFNNIAARVGLKFPL